MPILTGNFSLFFETCVIWVGVAGHLKVYKTLILKGFGGVGLWVWGSSKKLKICQAMGELTSVKFFDSFGVKMKLQFFTLRTDGCGPGGGALYTLYIIYILFYNSI